MAKIDIPAVPSGFATTAALNARLQQIEDEFNNKVLYRTDTGIEPNTMQDSLDMGTKRIINVGDAIQDKDAVNFSQAKYLAAIGANLDELTTLFNVVDTFTGNGVTTSFPLTATPPGVNGLDVSVGGIVQIPTVDYQVSGQNVLFTVAPDASITILCKYGRPIPLGASDSSAVAFKALGTGAVDRYAQDKMREYVSPEDYGVVGDGVTDDTAAFQTAINAVSNSSSSVKTILLGAKKYRIVGTLRIDAQVQIIGQGKLDVENSRALTIPPGGSWFIHANPTGPLFQCDNNLGKGSRLANFGIYQEGHNTPVNGVAWTPTVRDWAIRVENTQGVLYLDHIHFHNVYQGVLTDFVFRAHYTNITGQFFVQGFAYDRIYDVCALDKVHGWNYWSEHDEVVKYMQAHTALIVLFRVDGLQLDHLFCIGYAVGIITYDSPHAPPYGGSARVITCGSLYCDFTRSAVVATANNSVLSFQFIWHLGQVWPPTPALACAGAKAISIESGNNTIIQVAHLYSTIAESATVVINAGAGHQIWIQSLLAIEYDFSNSGSGACYINSPSSAVYLGSKPALFKHSGTTPALCTGASTGQVFEPVQQQHSGANSLNSFKLIASQTGQLAVFTTQGETNAGMAIVAAGTGIVQLGSATNSISMYGGAAAPKAAITGAKVGNVALASIAAYGAARGWWTDSTT